MSSDIPLTLIIADVSSQAPITDCLKNVNSWFPQKIIVSNNPNLKETLAKDPVDELVECNSKSIYQLWKKGVKKSETQWNVLVTSNEIITGQLKVSIENQIKNTPRSDTLFKFNKKVIFLKKVLKYPLEWPDEFPSCLVFFCEAGNFSFKPDSYSTCPFLKGELVHFGNTSITESVQEVTRLAEINADRLMQSDTTSHPTTLVFKSFWMAGWEIVNSLLFKKALREGYEGVAFSILGGAVPLFCFLSYFEKHFRAGGRIKQNLSEVRNILIVKLGGAGDIILATPVIRNLKKLLPQVKLHVLVLSDVAPLLRNNPYIDSMTLINFDSSKQAINKIATSLKQYKLDLAINLQSTNFSSKVLRRIPSRWKINRSYYFRDKNTDVLVGFSNTYRSVIERDLDVLRCVGLNPIDKYTEVFLSEGEIAWAKEFFLANDLSRNKKTVVVHPCSSLKIRSWGVDKFALTCRNIILKDDCQVIVSCSQDEINSIAPIRKLVPEAVVFSGSLRELLSLINASDLLIGNDSGPSQFSAALNIPTLTINGPSTSSLFRDPDLFQGKHYTFNKEVHCRDLFHTQCMSKTDPMTNHPVCDEMICLDFSVEEVTAKALDLLKVSDKRNFN